MTSALGNYIHFKHSNYKDYGTARTGETPQHYIDSYNAQKQKNQERIAELEKRNIDQATLQELEGRVSNESMQKQAKNSTEQILTFYRSAEGYLEELQDFLIKNAGKGIKPNSTNINIGNNMANYEQAKKIRENLYKKINSLNKDMEIGKSVKVEEITNLFEQFFKSLNITGTSLTINPDVDTLTALKYFLSTISVSEASNTTFKGTYGEVLVNMADDCAKNLADKELTKAMRQAIDTGKKGTSFKIEESMIPKDIQQEFLKKTDINLYRAKWSQDKVDASITLNNKQVEASVKAYKPKDNSLKPKLQELDLLSSLLTTEQQFGNHWLSLHAVTASGNSKSADSALKEYMAYEAMAHGNMLKKDAVTADTFVAIDTTSGKVYVKSVADVLKSDLANFSFGPDLGSIRIRNKFADSWEQRIANILAQVHQIKIRVKYKISLIK